MMSNQVFLICLLFYISISAKQAVQALREGEACTINNVQGICKTLNTCPAAIQALQIYRQKPVLCEYSKSSPIPVVCCAETQQPTKDSTPAPPDPTPSPIDPAIARSKSFQKCKEYSQYVYEWIYPPTQTSEKIRVNRCVQRVIPLVIGGENAQLREFPHMCALGFVDGKDIKWSCGGTLVSENYCLTAGHCTYTQEYGDVKRARVGDLNLNVETDMAKPQEVDIDNIIRHPDYKPPSRYNDIALLHLATPVQLNPFVIPACLRYNPTISEHSAIATGWGRTSFGGDNSAILQKVTLELFTQNECNTTYLPVISRRKLQFGIVPETQLCAGHHTEEKDTCQGDSGGPLQVFQKNDIYCMYSIIGVTSFGTACGVIGSPGVYTRVSAYIPWIESVVWP